MKSTPAEAILVWITVLAITRCSLGRHAAPPLIEPRLEMGRPINNQSPYADRAEFAANNRFVTFENVAPPR
jgi:hypothetical protein